MQSHTRTIGSVKITQFIEVEAGEIIQEIIPDATKDKIKQIGWLAPHYADKEGNLKAVVQSFVIDTGNMRIIVDTCVGNDKVREEVDTWNDLQTDFLDRLTTAGHSPENIDVVLCTHLHFDHVGWNTMLVEDERIPTFPNARYLFAKDEFDYWKGAPEKEIEDDHQGFRDSVQPIISAGLVDIVDSNFQVCQEVRLIPTPGHTPGHVSIVIESGGEKAIITGDLMHHPCQIACPEWHTLADTSQEKARETRKNFLKDNSDSDTLIIGSHFSQPSAGRVFSDGKSYRLEN